MLLCSTTGTDCRALSVSGQTTINGKHIFHGFIGVVILCLGNVALADSLGVARICAPSALAAKNSSACVPLPESSDSVAKASMAVDESPLKQLKLAASSSDVDCSGTACSITEISEGLAAPVPEPGSASYLLLALVTSLGAITWRFRRRRAATQSITSRNEKSVVS